MIFSRRIDMVAWHDLLWEDSQSFSNYCYNNQHNIAVIAIIIKWQIAGYFVGVAKFQQLLLLISHQIIITIIMEWHGGLTGYFVGGLAAT